MDVKKTIVLNTTEKMKRSEKVTYGMGNMAANLLIATANSFIIYFYTDIVGIAAATVGTILLIARLFDGATDIVMGFIVDKTKSKHGKARPWLLWMAVPFGLAIIVLFSAPNLGDNGQVIYALVTYSLALGILYTAVTVPYNSMIGTLTQNHVDRGHLSVSRSFLGTMGSLLVSIITLPLVSLFGDGKQGWMLMATTYAVIAAAIYIWVFKNTKERVVTPTITKEKIPFKKGIVGLLKNKYWLITIGLLLLSFVGIGMGGVNIYYAQYVLGDSNLVGVMATAGLVPSLIMTLLIGPLMKRFSNRFLIIVGSIVGIAASLVILIDPQNITLLLVALAIKGLASAPALVACYSMLGDTVDYSEWKTGLRNEGLSFSAGTFGEKVGSGFGGMVLGIIMSVGGYVGGGATQSPEAIEAIKGIFLYVPIIMGILSVILVYFYKLDKEHPQIIADLQARKN